MNFNPKRNCPCCEAEHVSITKRLAATIYWVKCRRCEGKFRVHFTRKLLLWMFPPAIPLTILFIWILPYLPTFGILGFFIWVYTYALAVLTLVSYFLEFKSK